MGFDTIDTFPEPTDLAKFFPEPEELPVPPPKLTDAERKRIERQARRDAGLPDPRTVDLAIVTALAAALESADVAGRLREQGHARGLTLDLEPVLREALAGIRRARVEGQPVRKREAAIALQQRLRLRLR